MDQRRVVLAILLSLGVVLLYNEFVVKPRQTGPGAAPSRPVEAPEPNPPAATRDQPTDDQPTDNLSSEPSGSPIVVDTDLWHGTLTPRGARIASLELKGFRRTVQADSPLLELVQPGVLLPPTVVFGRESDATVPYTASTMAVDVHGDANATVTFVGVWLGRRIEKRLGFRGDSYLIDVELRFADTPEGDVALIIPNLEKEGLWSGGSSGQVASILSQGKVIEKNLTNLDAKAVSALVPEPRPDAVWIGFSMPFFLGAIVNPEGGGIADVEHVGSRPLIRMNAPIRDGRASFKLFMGPKSREVLEAAGFDLTRSLDFGWFWFIALPMLYALRQLHRVSGNYGVDIILLTGLVRAATIPLMQKSFRSMREMQKLQPQLKRLQEQHKDDQARLQKEMMELYKRNQVNPFSGCAPMLLQIPIFVGLYNALSHAIELRHAPFALWITDLSAPERLVVAGVGIPLLTILMGGTMIVQQWLTPAQADPTQRQMMMVMPVVFTFMFINFPSGLVLYWLVSNILGILQQWAMLRSSA